MATPKIFDNFKEITSNIEITSEVANAAIPKTGGSISGNLTVVGDLIADLIGNASTATKFSKAGKITLSGDASGSVSFDGTDATLAVTVKDDSHSHIIDNIDGLENALLAKAPLASPALTGTPTAPTATAGTNNTQIATTAFVNSTALPKSGGTMTGDILMSSSAKIDFLGENKTNKIFSHNSSKLEIQSGSLGGHIEIAGSESTDWNCPTGGVKIEARMDTELTQILVDPVDGVEINGNLKVNGSISGNAATATKLAASKTIAISGGATGTATAFDGSGNITIPVTALDVSKATAGTLAVARGGTGSSTKNFVDLSSNQTVAGMKSFNGTIAYVNPNVTVGTNPSAISYREFFILDKTGETASNHRLGDMLHTLTTDGTSKMTLAAYKFDASNTDFTTGSFTVQITKAGVVSSNVNGTFTATAVYNAVWNDYAEFFPRGEETEAGDFVALSLDSDNEVYVKASKETSKSVGIHSDSFGHLIGGEQAPEGQDFVEYNLPKYIPVGLVGRVRANIVGEVKKGDFIVISDIPGVGRAFNKETDSYVDIIGMACESSSEKDIKRIKVKLGN